MSSPNRCVNFKKNDEVMTSGVHPFWAVIRCINSKAANNMKLTMENFLIPQRHFKGCEQPNRDTIIALPVLSNIASIEKGDILTIPYMKEADDEE